VIRGLHAHGIEPVLTLLSTPRWANDGRPPNRAPKSGTSFATFAAAAARRYPFVRRSLIWNEPNQRRWLRPASPTIYVDRLPNPTYTAIHRVRRNALVGGGVTAPRGSTGSVSPGRVDRRDGQGAREARRVRPQPVPALADRDPALRRLRALRDDHDGDAPEAHP
jgi:hypothetical protein